MNKKGENVFALPMSANDVYGFCYWAGRDKGKSKKQDILSKPIEKYLYGLKAWHLLHGEKYPEAVDARVKVFLRASAKANTQEPPKSKKKAVHLKHLLHTAD